MMNSSSVGDNCRDPHYDTVVSMNFKDDYSRKITQTHKAAPMSNIHRYASLNRSKDESLQKLPSINLNEESRSNQDLHSHRLLSQNGSLLSVKPKLIARRIDPVEYS